MTPKEKAEELVIKYFKLLNYEFGDMVYSLRDKQPHQCALIAVKFALENPLNTNGYNKYLNEIINEIEYYD